MKKIATVLLAVLFSCSPKDSPEPIHHINFQFEDGFEVSDNDFQQLFPSDGSRWTNIQKVGNDNQIEIEEDTVSEGDNSLRLFAKATQTVLSKMDIEKSGFAAPMNSSVKIEADFFIASDADIENLLLLDLECCSCWDPSVPDNQCPGIRLMMKGNDFLTIERGKILGSTLNQNQVSFPRNEWVSVVWELLLSSEEDGDNRVLINGEEAISMKGMNMPNATLFREEAATLGVDFNLQEPVVYERVQIGITANPTQSDLEIFIDNFKITILK